MTPKEKAEELYKKMYTRHSNIYPSTAIECALIVVEEILTADMFMMTEEQEKYWEQVKKEIEKL